MNDNRLFFRVGTFAAMLFLATASHATLGPDQRRDLRVLALDLVNQDRARKGLDPIVLDPFATEVADAYAERQIRDRTTGHFTLDGLSPYMRYSFAGGNDGVSENAAAWSSSQPFLAETLPDLIRRSHFEMMAEKPPNDGHRKAILDPHATHLGIGLAWEGGEFRLVEEFVRRYLTWLRPAPRISSTGQFITIRARPIAGTRVESVTVHREPLPRPLTHMALDRIQSYSLPRERREFLPRLGVTWDRKPDGSMVVQYGRYEDGRQGDFSVERDGTIACPIAFADGPGIYTIVVWVRKEGGESAIPASSVSVRVDRTKSDSSGATLGR